MTNRGELAIASVKKKSASPTYPTGHQCTAFGSACFHHGLTFIFSSEFESNWQVCYQVDNMDKYLTLESRLPTIDSSFGNQLERYCS